MFISTGYAQDFLPGIHLFNRTQYDSLISYTTKFIPAHPGEEGLARYFLAESYYNKALDEVDAQQAKRLLLLARTEFVRAQDDRQLKIDFGEYYEMSGYKLGWCIYRLAEFDPEPISRLQQAYTEFTKAASQSSETIKIQAYFMAAECKIKESLSRFYHIADDGVSAEIVEQNMRSFADAENALDHVIATKPFSELHVIAQIRKKTLNFYRGKFYAAIGKEMIRADEHEAVNTAQTFFKKVRYDSLLLEKTDNISRFRNHISYLEMNRFLNQYLLSPSELVSHEFQRERNALRSTSFSVEAWFREANLIQGRSRFITSNGLQAATQAYFTATALPESFYWLAQLEMINGHPDDSNKHFLKFIDLLSNRNALDFREKVLLSDAHYKRALLDFEQSYLKNAMGNIRRLDAQLRQSPSWSRVVRKNQGLLKLLLDFILIVDHDRLWDEVLTGTDTEKLDQAFKAVEFLLPRAALNIGITRQKYLSLLKRILVATGDNRVDKTRFFTGIVRTLEAEIQPRIDEKVLKFRRAADLLRSIRSSFDGKIEAEYIRGVCLFFADELDQAEVLFKSLINQENYLRAVFYLAEICRAKGQGLAAKRCYKVIIEKFRGVSDEHSEFWLQNARAGIAACDDDGKMEILADVAFENVEYQPARRTGRLYYETLANERFLVQKNLRQSVNWLMKFGLPQKEFYVSKHKIAGSLFAKENIFDDVTPIDEKRGPVTASLTLTVYLPKGADPGLDVRLEQEKLLASDSEKRAHVFVKHKIPLDTEYELTIRNQDCYVSFERIRFEKPGENNRTVFLSKRLFYSAASKTQDTQIVFLQTQRPRWDHNMILNIIPEQSQDSELLRDFSGYYQLRDCAYDRKGRRILAVNSESNTIWTYNEENSSKRIGELPVPAITFNSPEGVALDSKGNIFITDWGNHRVVVLDEKGGVFQTFGRFGHNDKMDSGQPVKFTFPTRVAVAEDREGIEVDQKIFYRETYLYVADQNGVHICTLDGIYLDTVISPSKKFQWGAFYGIRLSGYGEKS
ncbi:MAG: hypothetical protein ACE5IR_07105, partial [bacterium]